MAKFATWGAFEFALLNVNVPDLGTPCGWRTPSVTEETLRMIMFPESIAKYEKNKEAEEPAEKGRGKKKKEKPPVAEDILDYHRFVYRPDIAKLIGRILIDAREDPTDICYGLKLNANVMFNLQTVGKPCAVTSLPGDNSLRGKNKFDIHLVQIPSPTFTEANSLILVLTPLDENYDPIQLIKYIDIAFKRSQDKITEKVHDVKNPRDHSNTINKMDQYGTDNPLSHDKNITSAGFFNENQLDSIRAKSGGADLADTVENMSGIKSSSLVDEELGIINMLIEYFELSERAAFAGYCKEMKKLEREIPTKAKMAVRTETHGKKGEFVKAHMYSYSNRTEVDYTDYRHALNPSRLFTIENAFGILQFIEESLHVDLAVRRGNPANSSASEETGFSLEDNFTLRCTTPASYPWAESGLERLHELLNDNSELEKLYDADCYWTDVKHLGAKFLDKMQLTDKTGCFIFHYDHVLEGHFCWLKKEGASNVIQGLSSEYFPWSKPIYVVPQSLLRYKANAEYLRNKEAGITINSQQSLIQKKTIPDEYLIGNVVNASVGEEIKVEGYDADFINDNVLRDGKILRKETDYLYPGTTWKGIPFNPLYHTQSFIPSCKLPVVYNVVMLHQACLKFRHDAMYALKPTFTDFLYAAAADRESDLILHTTEGILQISLIKYALGEISIQTARSILRCPNGIDRLNAYRSKYNKQAQTALILMNDFAKIKREYAWHCTHYFEDLFLNQANLGKFRTCEAFNRMAVYYIRQYKQPLSCNILRPARYLNFIVGSTAVLPKEDLMGLHVDDIATKMSILHDTFGKQKLKIHITAYAGIILGHMDLSFPMMFHMLLSGEKEVGKSRAKMKAEDCFVPGIARDFSAMSDNSLMVTGDRSGIVLMSEESINALFDKLEATDKVQLLKTLMSDGNLSKHVCSYDSGVRLIVIVTAFLRICIFICANRDADQLNAAIHSRMHVCTLGSSEEAGGKQRQDPLLGELAEGAGSKRARHGDNDGPLAKRRRVDPTEEMDVSVDKNTLMEEIREKYLSDLENKKKDLLEKVHVVIPTVTAPAQEEDRPADLRENPFCSVATMAHLHVSSQTIDENVIIGHYCRSATKKVQKPKANKTKVALPSEGQIYDRMSGMLKDCGIDTENQGNANIVATALKSTLKTHLEGLPADEEEEFAGDGLHGVNMQVHRFKSSFETSRDVSSGVLFNAQEAGKNYVRMESLISFFIQYADLEGRMPLSKHLFWILIPLLIGKIREKCPFVKVGQRSVTRMLILASNFQRNTSFRTEIMTPNDIWTGEQNPKYYLPFKHSFILDLAPRLFLTTPAILLGFTIIAEEIVNPWIHDVFMSIFCKVTKFFQFYTALMEFETFVNNETNRPWLLTPFKVFDTKETELPNSDRENPQKEIRSTINIPSALIIGNPHADNNESFFEGAKFLKYYDGNKECDVYDMNYIMLLNDVPASDPDTARTQKRTMIAQLVQRISGQGIRIGMDAIQGIVTRLFDETITVEYMFDRVDNITLHNCFQEELTSAHNRTVPHVSIVQKAMPPTKHACLSIRRLPVSPGVDRSFLLLLTASIIKTQSSDVVVDSIREFFTHTSNLESVLTLGLTKSMEGGLEADAKMYIDKNLEQLHLGLSSSVRVEDEQRLTNIIHIDNSKSSHLNRRKTAPHFHSHFVTSTLRTFFDTAEGELKLEAKRKEQQVTKAPVVVSQVPAKNTARKNIGRQSLPAGFQAAEIDFTDIQSLEDEVELGKQIKGNMDKEIPKDIVTIQVDLDKWAALMHLSSTHCSQLRLSTDRPLDASDGGKLNVITECRREKLEYFHQRVPTSSRFTSDEASAYINADEAYGDWRPLSALVPAEISKRAFKQKWKNFDNHDAFRIWKLNLLEFYNQHVISPSLEMTRKGSESVFYSETLKSYIPKYILRDLYHYQHLTNI